MTADGPGGRRPKSPRRNDIEAPAPVRGRVTTRGRQQGDEAWDVQMTRLLREAAEIREERDRTREAEDTLLSQRETAALLAAIRTRGRSREKRYIMAPSARRSRGTAQVVA